MDTKEQIAFRKRESNMNSKEHFIVSMIKSSIRIVSCLFSIIYKSITPIAIGFLGAEILGILEELVDKR